MEDCLRIGQFKPTRHREEFREMWADGWAFEEINKAQQRIANERNEIINASQILRKRKPTGNARDLKRYKRHFIEIILITLYLGIQMKVKFVFCFLFTVLPFQFEKGNNRYF